MSRHNLDFGKSSENAAGIYLRAQGYKILEVNYRNKLGEIDIVAQEAKTVCFIEVKSRSSVRRGLPQEAVNKHKQYKISRCALIYIKERRLFEQSCRFDVLAIIKDRENQLSFELIKDAFELDSRYSY